MHVNNSTQQASAVKVLTVPTPASKVTLGGTGPTVEYWDLMQKKYG